MFIVPALVLAAYALAAPPQMVLGSSELEHVKDAVACVIVAAGLALRATAVFIHPAHPHAPARLTVATCWVLVGVFLMHGHWTVLAIGVLVLAAYVRAPASRVDSPRTTRTVGKPSARDVAIEAAIVLLTAGLLVVTEVYEYLPADDVPAMRLALVLASGAAFAALLWTVWRERQARERALPRRRAEDGPQTRGIRVDRRVGSVDVFENLLSLGSLEPILHGTLDAAGLRPGDHVVDIGCGSGKLVIAAADIVGPEGDALGIDATPPMIDLARTRARAAGSAAHFQVAAGEALPLEDATVDAVTSSYFFHHLPSEVKRDALREMWRVLRPGGRLVITDYARPRSLRGWLASFPMRFNFYEYVRPQLRGELETLIASENIGTPEIADVFLGYITVFRLVKPATDAGAAGA